VTGPGKSHQQAFAHPSSLFVQADLARELS